MVDEDLQKLVQFVDSKVFDQTQRHLRDVEVWVFEGAWVGKKYEEIAQIHNYTPQYLQQDIGPRFWKLLSEVFQEELSKRNFRTVLERYFRENAPAFSPVSENRIKTISPQDISQRASRNDWGEAMDVSVFYGRHQELETLKQWVAQDRCRVIAILGMGGIGKTTLSIKLAEDLQAHFDVILWRSLRNAPFLVNSLDEWIQFLSHQTVLPQAESLDGKLRQLLNCLREQRCLLILDNYESVLQSGQSSGAYSEPYEDYGLLLRYLAETAHQSCLMLTSREKPKGFAAREGTMLPVRSLSLKGLEIDDVQQIFQTKGCGTVDRQVALNLSEHYGGNPLALKIVSSVAGEVASGDLSVVATYLQNGLLHFDDLYDLLAQHFERLSATEQQVMYWLAINRDPVSITQLESDFMPGTSAPALLNAFHSLYRRCLVEGQVSECYLQPVVQEHVSQRLIQGIAAEIIAEKPVSLRQYALLKAQSPDYVRTAQRRFLLQPLVEKLMEQLSGVEQVEKHLRSLLASLRHREPTRQPGYTAGNLINLLRYLEVDLTGLDASELAIWQVDFSGTSLVKVNFRESELSKCVFKTVLNATLSVAFSPDGRYFALGNADNKVRIWQVEEYKALYICEDHQSWIAAVAFSPDSQTLASGSFDCTIRLWDVETGQCRHTLMGHTGWVWAVSFSPDGRYLATGGDDPYLRIWETATGNCLQTFQGGHQGWVSTLAWTADGLHLAGAGVEGCIRLWNLQTYSCERVLQGHGAAVDSIVMGDQDQCLISGGHDGTIRVWDLTTGNCQQVLTGHQGTVSSLAYFYPAQFASHGMLATGGQDCTVRIWDLETGQCTRILQDSWSRIWAIAVHPNGQTLLSGSNDSTMKLWDLERGQSIKTVNAACLGVKTVTLSPDGQLLASGGDDKIIRLWHPASGECIRHLEGHEGWIWSARFSGDGRLFASASGDATIRIWDVRSGDCLRILQGHQAFLFNIAFHPKQGWIASGSFDQTARLWDAQSGDCLWIIPHQGAVWAVAFSPNGQYLATSGDRVGIKIWDIPTKTCVHILPWMENQIYSLAFSPEGNQIVGGSGTGQVQVWDWQQEKCLQTFLHRDRVWSTTFTPDGNRVLSGSFDRTICCWDLATGNCVQSLEGHTGDVWSVSMGRDGLTCASGGQDGLVYLWDLATGHPLQIFREQRVYENLDISDTVGLTTAQRQALTLLGAIG
jgi:WD40 repeat protein